MKTEIDFSIEDWDTSKRFDEQSFTEETMLKLIDFLKTNSQVDDLSFNSCSFDNKAIKLFSQIKTLTRLEFYKIKANSGWLEYVTENKSLEVLILNANKLSDQCIKSLVILPKLYKLELADNKIGDNGANTLSTIKTLSWLDLSTNHIGDDGAKALTSCKKLFCLNLSNNFIGDKGAIALASNLNTFWKRQVSVLRNYIRNQKRKLYIIRDKLKRFDFDMKNIDAELASYENIIWEDEYKYKGTSTLHLYNNNIGDIGAIALANLHIQELSLSRNKISARGAKALFKNSSLKSLNLDSNMIGNVAVKAIASNTSLLELRLNQCNINDDGAKKIAHNYHLRKLELGRNNIGNEGAKALTNCKNLSSLSINVKSISPNILELFYERVHKTANSDDRFLFWESERICHFN